MKLVLLKKMMSFIFPIVEKRLVGEHHSVLEVSWVNGNLWLNSIHANYSFGSLHQVFKKAFRYFNLKETKFNSVLILGFGAGSVKQILRKEYQYNGKIKGIEYDGKIIDLGRQYFDVPQNNDSFRLLHTDATVFLNETTSRFDLIVIDLFNELEIPDEFLEKSFLEKVMNCKSEKGIIIFNVIDDSNKNILTSLSKKLNQLSLKIEVFTLHLYGTTNYVLKIY